MPSKVPDCPKTPVVTADTNQIRHFKIKLITPMFGGGATVGIVDTDFPIRSTAIRGHLRGWWRLVHGHSLGDKMWRREEEIFGSTEFPSPVTVSVKKLTEVRMLDAAKKGVLSVKEAYALFPAIENKLFVTEEGLEFEITVQIASEGELKRCRDAQNKRRTKAKQSILDKSIVPIEDDVTKALSAWLNFGGIGGRTRRGCGAVYCEDFKGKFPQLLARTFLGPAKDSPIEAWGSALEAYRIFRQEPRGRKHDKVLQNGNTIIVPGRSHWPEADSIRKITGCSLKPPAGTLSGEIPADIDTHDHSNPVVPSNLLPSFPKAVLGLPINFHFADCPPKGQNASVNHDPKDVKLYPMLRAKNGDMKKADRMASPVITRPLYKENKWYPAIIIFNQSLPEGMRFRLEGQNAFFDGKSFEDLAFDKVVHGSLGKIEPMRGKSNAIDALIDFLGDQNRGFKEVNR